MADIQKPVAYFGGAGLAGKTTEPIAARAKNRQKNGFHGFDYYNFYRSTKGNIEGILTDPVKLETLQLRVSEKNLSANETRSISFTSKKDYGAVVISEKLSEVFYRSEVFNIAAEILYSSVFADDVLFFIVMRDLEEFKDFLTKGEVKLYTNKSSPFYPQDRTQNDMKESQHNIRRLMEEYDIQVTTPSIDRIIIVENNRIIDTHNT